MPVPHLRLPAVGPLAQETPTQTWVGGWLEFLENTLPAIFLVIVIVVGTILIVKSRGGLQKAIIFGLGAALVFLILTNVDNIADLLEQELPVESED